jgi:predicted RNA-binding protein YlqC (UPF0109 family)
MDDSDPVRTSIEYMVKGLVDEPELVNAVVVPREEGALYRLTMAPKDIVKIVGKQNQTVRSMRLILSAVGTKLNRKVVKRPLCAMSTTISCLLPVCGMLHIRSTPEHR